MHPQRPVRRLFVEQLENRAVFAGNVLAEMVDDTLVITGDEFDNALNLTYWGDGVIIDAVLGTSINGGPGLETFTGVGRVEFSGGDGDDLVQAFLYETVGELRIDTGAGRDGVLVSSSSGSDVFIDTGDGADVASVRSFSGFGEVGNYQIATRDGADQVFLDLGLHLEGAVRVDTGNGNDSVEVLFEGGQSGGSLSTFTGNGNDTVTLHTHGTPPGVDVDLTIDGGHGVDTLFYNPYNFDGEVDILDIERYV